MTTPPTEELGTGYQDWFIQQRYTHTVKEEEKESVILGTIRRWVLFTAEFIARLRWYSTSATIFV